MNKLQKIKTLIFQIKFTENIFPGGLELARLILEAMFHCGFHCHSFVQL